MHVQDETMLGTPMTDREQGIEFGEFTEKLEEVEYPIENDELVVQYGDYEVKHANGSEKIQNLLGPLEETFEGPEGVRQQVFNMIEEGSIGREEYSDRAGSTPDGDREQESL